MGRCGGSLATLVLKGSPKRQEGSGGGRVAEERAASIRAECGRHSQGWSGPEAVGGGGAPEAPGSIAGTIAGWFVCLFGKREPGVTVARL